MAIYTTSDSYTKLLIHSDGPDDSQTFVDSSQSAHTFTANGEVKHENSRKKFGSTSIYFDSSDSLQIPDSGDWNFGAGDFTIDFWVNFSSIIAQGLWMQNQSTGATDMHFLHNSSAFRLWVNSSSSNIFNMTWSYTAVQDEWIHVALVRAGDNFTVYVDGVSLGTNTASGTIPDIPEYVRLGQAYYSGWMSLHGYMDEIRVSKGIARWTSDFTPPNKPYDIINTETQTADSKEDTAFEVTGGGNAQFGSNIVTRSDPGEASTDSIFSVNKKDGQVITDVFASGTVRQTGVVNSLEAYIETRVYPLVGGTLGNMNTTIDPLVLDQNAMYEVIYASQNYDAGQNTGGWKFVKWHGYDGSGGGGDTGGDNFHMVVVEESGTGDSDTTPTWTTGGVGGNARLTYGNGYMSYRTLTIRSYTGYTGFKDI